MKPLSLKVKASIKMRKQVITTNAGGRTMGRSKQRNRKEVISAILVGLPAGRAHSHPLPTGCHSCLRFYKGLTMNYAKLYRDWCTWAREK